MIWSKSAWKVRWKMLKWEISNQKVSQTLDVIVETVPPLKPKSKIWIKKKV